MKSISEKPSESSVYLWNITASIANAGLSVLILAIATRMLNNNDTDIFSIAWSISQLMATVGTYQIRTYQATDVEENFKFSQYVIFRIITVGIMMIASVVYIGVKRYDAYKGMIVLILCLFRAVDAIADVYEGWFQQKERLDLAGKACTYRVLFALVGFGISLIITRNMLIACIILVISYIVCFVLYDIRYCRVVPELKENRINGKNVRWIIKLALEGFPLFFNAFLMMSISNAPKMALDTAIANNQIQVGIQTVFNILFMPASFLTLAYIVFRPLLTKMAIYWNNNKIQKFLKIVFLIVGCLLGTAVVLLVGCAILGIPVLSILYAIDLKDYKMELLIIVAGGCFCTFSYVFDNALVVIRRQYMLVLSYIISWIYIKLTVTMYVDKYGMLGAAIAYATCMLVFLIVTVVIFSVFVRKDGKKK